LDNPEIQIYDLLEVKRGQNNTAVELGLEVIEHIHQVEGAGWGVCEKYVLGNHLTV